MKSLHFVSLLWTVTIFSLALVAHDAKADDGDLPEPGGGFEEEIPAAPPPQDDLAEENLLPDPETGEESLPEPNASLETNRQSSQNQVNRVEESDDIFLPTPANQDSVNYAPLGSPVSNRTLTDTDWRLGLDNRPVFSLHAGGAVYNYASEAVQENRFAGTMGASVRLFNLAQTIFLHAYGSVGWVKVGPVGPFTDVKDTVLHYGGLLEVGIGRRLSLFGSALIRSHTLGSKGGDSTGVYGSLDRYAPDMVNEGLKLGVGLQYDFYVVPHGSIGIRGHIEQDMGLVALTMALEPRPRKRLSLNYQD